MTTQSWVVYSDYKSPYPLRHDWIDPMPENSSHNNLKLLGVYGVYWSFITITTSVGNFKEIENNRDKKDRGLNGDAQKD